MGLRGPLEKKRLTESGKSRKPWKPEGLDVMDYGESLSIHHSGPQTSLSTYQLKCNYDLSKVIHTLWTFQMWTNHGK